MMKPTTKLIAPILFVLSSFPAFANNMVLTKVNDSQVVTALNTANTGEINMASQATKHGNNQRVRDFAAMMKKAHTEANQDLSKLSSELGLQPENSKISADLKKSTSAEIKKIKSLNGADYDKEYMDAQVNMHKGLLSIIDDNLIPQAKGNELKTLLEKVRAVVAEHLVHAKEIYSSLQ